MKSIKIYQVDAFTDTIFSGNPAAVCVLDKRLDSDVMQQIASENNLSETAFLVKNDNQYDIRWFTPNVEVDLCGHATLASAFVLFKFYEKEANEIRFHSHRSGELTVNRSKNEYMTMNFPSDVLEEIPTPAKLTDAIGKQPLITFKGRTDLMLVFDSQSTVESLQPKFEMLKAFDYRGIICTASGDNCHFVSRFFAPNCGINEDPVTGSAHTTLTPYWAKQLKIDKLNARQISARGGELHCNYLGERVEISGKAVLYLVGHLFY